MDQAGVLRAVLHSLDGCLARVAGTVIHDPIDGARERVRLARHDLFNQSAERFDPRLVLDPGEQVGVMHLPRGEVGQGVAALLLKRVRPA